MVHREPMVHRDQRELMERRDQQGQREPMGRKDQQEPMECRDHKEHKGLRDQQEQGKESAQPFRVRKGGLVRCAHPSACRKAVGARHRIVRAA